MRQPKSEDFAPPQVRGQIKLSELASMPVFNNCKPRRLLLVPDGTLDAFRATPVVGEIRASVTRFKNLGALATHSLPATCECLVYSAEKRRIPACIMK
jgi:hypothetical protein